MMDHPIEGLMKTTMDSIKGMMDVSTIVGDPVKTDDGGVIIPISKVCIGFASGGSEFDSSKKDENGESYPFGGGSGAGMSLQPVAFLYVKDKDVKVLPVRQSNNIDRIIDRIPGLLDDFKTWINNKKEAKKTDETNPS